MIEAFITENNELVLWKECCQGAISRVFMNMLEKCSENDKKPNEADTSDLEDIMSAIRIAEDSLHHVTAITIDTLPAVSEVITKGGRRGQCYWGKSPFVVIGRPIDYSGSSYKMPDITSEISNKLIIVYNDHSVAKGYGSPIEVSTNRSIYKTDIPGRLLFKDHSRILYEEPK